MNEARTDLALQSFLHSYNTTLSSSGNQTLNLDVDVSIEGGYYVINCELPNTAAVRSYEVHAQRYRESYANSERRIASPQ